MKKILLRIIIFVAIVAIIFSPYLLAIDFRKYSPLVFIIWVLTITYYLLFKKRMDRRLQEKSDEEEPG